MQTFNFSALSIPTAVVKTRLISSTAKLCLADMFNQCDEEHQDHIFLNTEKMADRLGLSISQVNKAIKELEKKELLLKDESNKYYFLKHEIYDTSENTYIDIMMEG